MADRILVVEGEEDRKLFSALFRAHQIADVDIHFQPSGKGNAISTFCAVLRKQTKSSRSRVGLVVDADFEDAGAGNRESVKDINAKALKAGFGPMTAASGGGYEVRPTSGYSARVGVWVMPDCSGDGYTEHLLVQAVGPGEKPRFDHAKSSCDGALTQRGDLAYPVRPNHRIKAHLGTWLAWQDPPRMSFGSAVDKGLFDPDHPGVRSLVSWLRWLYL